MTIPVHRGGRAGLGRSGESSQVGTSKGHVDPGLSASHVWGSLVQGLYLVPGGYPVGACWGAVGCTHLQLPMAQKSAGITMRLWAWA